MSKDKVNVYELWFGRLSPAARQGIRGAGKPAAYDDDTDMFSSWRKGLSEGARESIDEMATQQPLPPEAEADPSTYRYACVECEDGELPVVRVFRSADALARYMGKLEGRDVCVMPFYGNPLAFSVGPIRYLRLPDHNSILIIPPRGEGPCRRIDADLVEFEPQEDHYLGPYELANSTLVADKLAAMKKEGQPSQDEGDDEDEDEDEDAAGVE